MPLRKKDRVHEKLRSHFWASLTPEGVRTECGHDASDASPVERSSFALADGMIAAAEKGHRHAPGEELCYQATSNAHHAEGVTTACGPGLPCTAFGRRAIISIGLVFLSVALGVAPAIEPAIFNAP